MSVRVVDGWPGARPRIYLKLFGGKAEAVQLTGADAKAQEHLARTRLNGAKDVDEHLAELKLGFPAP